MWAVKIIYYKINNTHFTLTDLVLSGFWIRGHHMNNVNVCGPDTGLG